LRFGRHHPFWSLRVQTLAASTPSMTNASQRRKRNGTTRQEKAVAVDGGRLARTRKTLGALRAVLRRSPLGYFWHRDGALRMPRNVTAKSAKNVANPVRANPSVKIRRLALRANATAISARAGFTTSSSRLHFPAFRSRAPMARDVTQTPGNARPDPAETKRVHLATCAMAGNVSRCAATEAVRPAPPAAR
jgi:hypothetical protein